RQWKEEKRKKSRAVFFIFNFGNWVRYARPDTAGPPPGRRRQRPLPPVRLLESRDGTRPYVLLNRVSAFLAAHRCSNPLFCEHPCRQRGFPLVAWSRATTPKLRRTSPPTSSWRTTAGPAQSQSTGCLSVSGRAYRLAFALPGP